MFLNFSSTPRDVRHLLCGSQGSRFASVLSMAIRPLPSVLWPRFFVIKLRETNIVTVTVYAI